jgi:phytoene dehydrogenase-like protein
MPTAPATAARPFDAAVVGAGPNGLAAALRLQEAGLRVVLYERAAEPGGGLRTEALTLPGFWHDTCSAIHPMALSAPCIQRLPLADHGLRWVQPPAPLAHPFADRPALTLERSVDETADQLEVDAGAYRRFARPFVDRWAALVADALGPPGLPASPLLLAHFGVQALIPARLLAQLWFRGRAARALFAGVAGHSVLPLDRSPSAAIGMMLQFAGHAVGWPFPAGGAAGLSRAMAALFVARGGTLRCGVDIDALDAIETDGPVLFDTGPRALSRIAGSALPAGTRARLERYRYGPGLFKVDWALSGPIPWADPRVGRAATVHIGEDLDEIAESEAAPWRGGLSAKPYLILVQCSLFDDSRAPAGQHTAWAYLHTPAHDPRDHTALIEARIERLAPGFRDRILARHQLSPAGLEARNPNYIGGDVNGGAADLDQLFTRPLVALPYQTPNPRIYLCSASTPPGGGVHGMGGDNAARLALRRMGLQPRLDGPVG